MRDEAIFRDIEVCGGPRNRKLSFKRASYDEADFVKSLHIRNAAMRVHLERRWVWSGKYQEQLHRKRYFKTDQRFIISEGREIGTIAVTDEKTSLYISDFYILPIFQGCGIGSAIIERLIAISEMYRKSLQLHVLSWNPAKKLYLRYGFEEIREDDINITMAYHPPSPLE